VQFRLNVWYEHLLLNERVNLLPFFDRSEELKWFPTYSFDKEAVIYAGEGQSFYPQFRLNVWYEHLLLNERVNLLLRTLLYSNP